MDNVHIMQFDKMQSSLEIIKTINDNSEVKKMEYRSSDEVKASSSFVLSLLLGLQAITVLLLPLVYVAKNLMDLLCILPDDPVRIQVVSLMIMVTGISTLLFNTFEKRLHVLFSPSVRYYKIVSNSLSLHRACPGSGDLFAMGFTKRSFEWKSRMNTVQSGLIFTHLLTALAGLTGLCRVIDSVLSNDLVLIPATFAVGISQVEDLFALRTYASNESLESSNSVVVIVIMTIIPLVIASFKFGAVKFRVPSYSLKEGLGTREYKLFQLFAIFISPFYSVFFYPGLCALIYGLKSYESGHPFPEQDDAGSHFLLHMPFKFGWPKLDYGMMINLLPDVFINTVTSIIIFRVTCFTCGEKTLTKTVTNGVLGESLINLILAGFGLSSNVSAFNIGLGKLTGIMHQRMLQLCGLSLLLIAIHPPTLLALSKTSVFHLQAIHFITSMLVSVTGLSMIQGMRHLSNRDFTVIGSSIFSSFFLPNIILTSGSSLLFPVLLKLLSSSVVVAIFTAVIADRILEGRKADDENDGQHRNNHLSFSEELFSLCF
ncbi:hypothetical protein LSTR_LSTR001573 [Laodelphax striatellus]|uniref:SLC26A/SulP transporter domain-containing protein n=1 Tax=Laodelphax striatellus TaxID=195883 RepID=A0A482XCC0_LAOST|nr:hypothetical protein LSTR_LSTR001573 [Laodelphax striatellus]